MEETVNEAIELSVALLQLDPEGLPFRDEVNDTDVDVDADLEDICE